MERVAHELQTMAFARKSNAIDLDLFGRSAFNRYYYATFLEVRAMLRRFRPDWRGSHSSVPDELNGWVSTHIRQTQRRVARLEDSQAVTICRAAASATADLASLMSSAYAVRVVADYEPEIEIRLDGSRFRLERTSVTDAHGWIDRAKADIAKIDRARSLDDAF